MKDYCCNSLITLTQMHNYLHGFGYEALCEKCGNTYFGATEVEARNGFYIKYDKRFKSQGDDETDA